MAPRVPSRSRCRARPTVRRSARSLPKGVFLEQLETDPASYLPDTTDEHLDDDVVHVDLNRPMADILAELTKFPVKTRLSLTGPLVVARDIAHAKIKERLDAGEEMPSYLRDHAVYYAGPAKTPEGYASGSFGPTTAGRMDSYVEQFQAAGGSLVMLAKGNRSKQVTEACAAHGGFYLGSIGGPAARLAQDCITSVEVLEYPELGMEAVWKIEVRGLPGVHRGRRQGQRLLHRPVRGRHRPPVGDPGALRAVGRPQRHTVRAIYGSTRMTLGQATRDQPRATSAASIWSRNSSGASRSPSRGSRRTVSPDIDRAFCRKASDTTDSAQVCWMPSISTTSFQRSQYRSR